jgi:hypothetical protein
LWSDEGIAFRALTVNDLLSGPTKAARQCCLNVERQGFATHPVARSVSQFVVGPAIHGCPSTCASSWGSGQCVRRQWSQNMDRRCGRIRPTGGQPSILVGVIVPTKATFLSARVAQRPHLQVGHKCRGRPRRGRWQSAFGTHRNGPLAETDRATKTRPSTSAGAFIAMSRADEPATLPKRLLLTLPKQPETRARLVNGLPTVPVALSYGGVIRLRLVQFRITAGGASVNRCSSVAWKAGLQRCHKHG